MTRKSRMPYPVMKLSKPLLNEPRNASRAKTFGQALGDAADRVLQAARNSNSPNKTMLESIMARPPQLNAKLRALLACNCHRRDTWTEEEHTPSCPQYSVPDALATLKAAVRELIAAKSSQTKGAYNLGVKGAARKKMIAKEQRRLIAAWIRIDRLSAES
jgi:hypothetical protein